MQTGRSGEPLSTRSHRLYGDGRPHGARVRGALLRSTLLLFLMGAVTLTVPHAAASTPGISAAEAVAGEFQPADCPVDVPPQHAGRVTCAVLTVPERRTPDGNSATTIDLPVAIIASRSETPVADPLVFPTSGGPGGGSLDHLGYWLDYADWAAEERDIILIEQRGDAHARPSLDCPELDLEQFVVDGELLSATRAAPAASSRSPRAVRAWPKMRSTSPATPAARARPISPTSAPHWATTRGTCTECRTAPASP